MPDPISPSGNGASTDAVSIPVIEYEMKIRARIVGGLIASFTAIVICWTWKPPQLPGDLAGAIVGGFVGWIGGMITTWGTSKK